MAVAHSAFAQVVRRYDRSPERLVRLWSSLKAHGGPALADSLLHATRTDAFTHALFRLEVFQQEKTETARIAAIRAFLRVEAGKRYDLTYTYVALGYEAGLLRQISSRNGFPAIESIVQDLLKVGKTEMALHAALETEQQLHRAYASGGITATDRWWGGKRSADYNYVERLKEIREAYRILGNTKETQRVTLCIAQVAARRQGLDGLRAIGYLIEAGLYPRARTVLDTLPMTEKMEGLTQLYLATRSRSDLVALEKTVIRYLPSQMADPFSGVPMESIYLIQALTVLVKNNRAVNIAQEQATAALEKGFSLDYLFPLLVALDRQGDALQSAIRDGRDDLVARLPAA